MQLYTEQDYAKTKKALSIRALVLAVLMVVAFQVMRTVLKIFEASETGIRSLREKLRERRPSYLLGPGRQSKTPGEWS